MPIFDLKDEPEHIETLADWHHSEWSYLSKNGSVSDRKNRMRSYLDDNAIPTTFICKHENNLVGSAAIVTHDMDVHKAWSPWLSSVYVHPGFRGSGVGSGLVLHVMNYAKELGAEELFLFNDGKRQFYSALGWSVFAEESQASVLWSIVPD